MLRFDHPLWLVLGAVCGVLLWVLLAYLDRRRSDRLRRFAAPALIPELTHHISTDKRRLKKYLLVSAVLLCFTALARPQYGHRWINVKHKGIDILFALDSSKSMLAEDIRPNRLERSKLAIMDFVSGLSGDRVGLLPFAGSAYLLCPLTADYQAFEQTLMSVDQTTVPDGGTDIGAAIDGALKTLTNEANQKFLIVITDGEVLQGDVIGAARRAAEHDMVIHTVGVGTREGELIPNPESGGFVQNDKGKFVKSRLDPEKLATIADITGGLSVLLGSSGQGLETIYRQKLAAAPRAELAEKRTQVPIERFGWPLGLAIVLLSIELVLSERKNGIFAPTFMSLIMRRSPEKLTVITLLFLFAGLLSEPSVSFSSEAEELYGQGNYTEAQQRYRTLLEARPDDPRLLFNSGAAAYKENDFESAARSFEKALPTDDLRLQEKVYYNRGNALYRLGEQQQEHDSGQVDRVIDLWQQAASSFDSALALNPGNKQARANLAFVKEKLKKLNRKQRNRSTSDDTQPEHQSEGEQRKQPAPGQRGPDDASAEEQNRQSQRNQAGDRGESRSAEQEQPGRNTSAEQSRDGATKPEPDGDQERTVSATKSQSAGIGQNASGNAEMQSMSTEEAEQLLQSLKAEEGWLGIVAPSQKEPKSTRQDW